MPRTDNADNAENTNNTENTDNTDSADNADSATPSPRRIVIIGGSLAGLLAAAATAEHADEVIVLERDTLPVGPQPRIGLPQASHVHLLWSGGARAMEALLPGTVHALLAAGARRVPVPTDMVAYAPRGWFRRWNRPTSHYVMTCSRDLLDSVIRSRIRPHPRITIREQTQVLGLTGGRRQITGVRVRTRDGVAGTIRASLVIDASGRGSRAPQWLAALGAPRPDERSVDSGLVYASRTYRAPDGTPHFPIVNVQADPRGPGPGRSAALLPIEQGRWLVTLAGTRGGEPSGDPDAFLAFAWSLRHPIVGDLIAGAKPLTEVTVTRSTVNRRRFYERMKNPPEGFAVLGDAVASYNPVYGHGMSVAAQGALALRETLRRHVPGTPGLTRTLQQELARPVSAAWSLATSQDALYPGTGRRPSAVERIQAAYASRLQLVSASNYRVAVALTDVMSLQRPASRLLRPDVVLAALLGPQFTPLDGPPLTRAELAVAHGRTEGPWSAPEGPSPT
ncbi:NAD(P)/FAD-dependent oxidoreductase [Streptomyces albipurpureus]|uniref:FAD-dependent monooxygenase n=1 Tax=Streptomyces albipurpureus TaxID=2897419 RepID=A0ABT0V047_9ACTN|nr:FAD-dependent monooxygenase [Streptomyces sp. CWNU-1]MCM2394174.1 FAD-dependent monooxygenase [Streptomyces sp. CWNU-1]